MSSLNLLEEQIAAELEYLNQPAKNWVKPRRDADGQKALDVAIIGAGASGMALAFALKRDGVRNVVLFDRRPQGEEGPWITTARMETLRSPKHLTGPNLGMPSLTFRAWHEASFGTAAWEPLGKIPKEMWMDYLVWYRKVLKLRIENGTALERITPEGDLYQLDLVGPSGPKRVAARHVVLATGRAASGGVSLPEAAKGLPTAQYAHTEDVIEYPALKGRDIVVVGGAASAVDAAATALEQGAGEVHMLIRAPEMPRINKFKNIVYPGFLRGYYKLPDQVKWEMMKAGFDPRVAPPRDSMLRLKPYPNFHLHFGAGLKEIKSEGDRLVFETAVGTVTGDFAIFGTGYAMNLAAQNEIAPFADDICLWRDVFTPPSGLEDRTLGAYPYLGEAFQFLPKPGQSAPHLDRLYMFNAAATLTHAPISSDIPGTNTGADRLAGHLIEQLFIESGDQHLQDLKDFDEPELLGDEWDS
ncbi:MAG: NAD(P)/FAD-dependent oxidoreductase [Sneathiella sp.]|nr:NAD(P)/FAD-dependent oxidoreductase [Sneathiella sp.]